MSFEAAARAIHQSVKRDAFSAFECCARKGKLNAQDFEVWCAMCGVRIASQDDVDSRIVPILAAVQTYFRDSAGNVTWEELKTLTLCEEAGNPEKVVSQARSHFSSLNGNGGQLLETLGKGVSPLPKKDVFDALVDRYGMCGSVILAESMDCDGDGVVSASDAHAWLVPPRPLEDLRTIIAGWVRSDHDGRPRRAFDSLDVCGRGLASRADLKLGFGNRLNLTEPELDLVFSSLDDDMSGCVSHKEFKTWLIEQDNLGFSDDDEKDDDATTSSGGSRGKKKIGIFASAAAQLRMALIERVGSATCPTKELRAEFKKIDVDGSGEISSSEFESLVRSIGVEIDDERHHDDEEIDETLLTFDNAPGSTTSLEGLGLIVEEVVPTRHGRDRTLVVHAVKRPHSPSDTTVPVEDVAPAVDGCRERDEILSVCGTSIAQLAADLDDTEELEMYPLDALTRRVDAQLLSAATKDNDNQRITLLVRRRRARRITRKQLEILLRAIDADSNGTISVDEIAHFILESPEEGERELGLAIEAARADALTLAERSTAIDHEISARAFAAIADSDKTTSARHVVATTAVARWLRGIRIGGDRSKTRISRRQASILVDRLDANGDGVVSRSEFDAWLFPRRSLEDLVVLLLAKIDNTFDGDVAAFHSRLVDEETMDKLHFAANLKQLGCALKQVEIDSLLMVAARTSSSSSKRVPSPKRLTLEIFSSLLGRTLPGDSIPSPATKRIVLASTVASPTHNVVAAPRRRTVHVIVPGTRTSHLRSQTSRKRLAKENSPRQVRRGGKQLVVEPADLARARRVELEKKHVSTISKQLESTYYIPDDERFVKLQAAARARPCRSMHDALRRESLAFAECQASLMKLAAARTDLVSERVCHAKKLLDVERESLAQLADRDATIDSLRSELDDERSKSRAQRKELHSQLAKLRAACSENVLAERRKVVAHYRDKMTEEAALKRPQTTESRRTK